MNRTKEKLQKGEVAIGLLTGITDEQLLEALGYSGAFDFLTIDIEHSPMSTETCERLIRVADVSGMTPLIRPLHNEPRSLLRFLDAGAMGFQAPLVEIPEDVRGLLDGMLYPPQGQRGLAMVRAARYGFGEPVAEYVARANKDMLLVAQLETRKAVENLPALLDTPGIDVYYVGPVDLSLSYGHPGKPDHAEVVNAIESIRTQVLAAGRTLGTIARNAEQARQLVESGYRYLALPLTGLFVQAARRLADEARAAAR